MNKCYEHAAAALAGLLDDGMLLAAGGFGLCGIPENLILFLSSSPITFPKAFTSRCSPRMVCLASARSLPRSMSMRI